MEYRVGVVGAAGFAGIELVRLLLAHPTFRVTTVTSDAYAGALVAERYPAFAGMTDLRFSANDTPDLAHCDAVFLAVPHTAALDSAAALLDAGVNVIDLSADFRLKDAAVYEHWYDTAHTHPDLLARAAFGLPEITGDELARAAAQRNQGSPALVACAGCYPTATSLAAFPALQAGLIAEQGAVVADAISGISGAGKSPNARNQFCTVNEDAQAYGVGTHRHTPEIAQILGLGDRLVFTPHLAPMNRGLLSTVTMPLGATISITTEELVRIYAEAYAHSPFVTVLAPGTFPQTRSVAGTNRAHIGVTVHEAARSVIAVCALDNLGKGAAGQAVQCANIIFGEDQSAGLDTVALAV
ncbi:N-acetyl-gamma-glutamyl-phosphate reductase [Adlercreutzia murintestinalis]|uniref:N-acetyl-gamma-glutamyl-phosphate reductase n=1 Tax=Adlercreutzia murintestinalis TaxID=2941325 RepID=UPI00203A3EFA|nr:N-acetyl-gamma-glutamyl-phosphate reductase [Adlercreutzia murintestinalis]